ncbi:MAG TPA: MerR family transcriptional regulator [Bryobacteraceae bacterium]|nr:MerR family transcriptional regulator [Bryobacteraceae bacterium]
MTIGQVAKQAGLRASAIRYYEKAGLIPRAGRTSGQRRYDASILEVLAVLEHAKSCGFTLEETRELFNGFHNDSHISERWKDLAKRKISELDAMAERIATMKNLLERIQACRCIDVNQCGRGILRKNCQ